MIKTSVYLTEQQHQWLKTQAEKAGVSFSDLVRIAIKEYIERKEKS